MNAGARAKAVLAVILLVLLTARGLTGAAEQGPGFPPGGWSREQLLCEYSRLTGSFSAGVNGALFVIAYSDGEYDWLRISTKAFLLGRNGPSEAWSREVSSERTHNITPLVIPSSSGGFHLFWVERPDEERYSIRYSGLAGDGSVLVSDTLLESAAGPIRDLTAVEVADGSIVLAWSDWRGRTLDVMAGKVLLEGGGARISTKVTYEGLYAERAMSTPRVAYLEDADEVALVWVESGFEQANLVASWIDPADLSVGAHSDLGSFTTASGAYPAIATGAGGGLYIAWPQDINELSFSATKTSDIMMARFMGRDLKWSGKLVDLPENQTAPSLAADGDDMILAWHDFSERSPHVWIGKPGPEGGFSYGPVKADYSLMASMKPFVGSVDKKAVLAYERFTSEGPRQAYLMSEFNPANPSILYKLGIEEAAPVKHIAFTLAMAVLRSALNVMLNIGAFALTMGFLWLLGRLGFGEGLKKRPELMAAATISFLLLLQATPLFVSLPGIYGPDFHAIVSVAAGLMAFALMRTAKSDWWLDSLMQLAFMLLWVFLQQFALLIPGLLKAGLM
ncbi:MAG TPA: hypothetical protein PKK63_00330 [Bacillota bacterium]|nr:hypothetical protein [Bacillota bacterium]